MGIKDERLNIKIFFIILIIFGLGLFLSIYPFFLFRSNVNTMNNAAIKYLDYNYDLKPSKNQITNINLKDLYRSSLIKKDFYIPYTRKLCSIKNSWVKVMQDKDGNLKYYTYLDCGIFKSNVDHDGPEIILKGKDEITLNKGDEYIELGVSKLKDNKMGNMNISNVKIDSSSVNTNKIGTYFVTYTASDSFSNKTIVKRKIKVVQKLNKTVDFDTNSIGIYKGASVNNYLLFSGMLFRIISVDDNNNVKIIAARDISSVNYDSIDKWLDYFYKHLSNNSKKLIVSNKFCNDKITSNDINKNLICKNKTSSRKLYVVSNNEINESRDKNGDSYLLFDTLNWTANEFSKTHAWGSKYNFIPYESGTQFYGFSKEYNFGIRPMFVIKGDTLIKSGDGSFDFPYYIEDIKPAKADTLLSKRYSGEYISYSSQLWRIIDVSKDGYIKVIADTPVELTNNSLISYQTNSKSKIYNPLEKGNIGYEINKKSSDTINEKYLATREINVPIYKINAKYKEEVKSNKYKVKFSAPNMYELFSGTQENKGKGYWLINSSLEEFRKYVVSNAGIVMYDLLPDHFESNVRPVVYFDKNVKIVNGNGTKLNPYQISK